MLTWVLLKVARIFAIPVEIFFEPFALMIFLAFGSSASNSPAVGATPAGGAVGAAAAPGAVGAASAVAPAGAAFSFLTGFAAFSSVAAAAGFASFFGAAFFLGSSAIIKIN